MDPKQRRRVHSPVDGKPWKARTATRVKLVHAMAICWLCARALVQFFTVHLESTKLEPVVCQVNKTSLLFVHERVPLFDSRGSDQRVLSLVEAFVHGGYEVTFVGLQKHPEVGMLHRRRLQSVGPKHVVEGLNSRAYEALLQECFDVAVLMLWYWRWPKHKNAADLFVKPLADRHPSMAIVLISDDVHFRREYDIETKGGATTGRWSAIKAHEIWLYNHVSAVLTVTREDALRLHADFEPPCPIGVLPHSLSTRTISIPSKAPTIRPGANLLFLGSKNSINDISLKWFLDECWSSLRGIIPHVHLTVVGKVSCPGGELGVTCAGPRANLSDFFQSTRVFLSPVSGGTGLNTKNVMGLFHGVPVVTSTFGLEGLLDPGQCPLDAGILVSQNITCTSFIKHIVDLVEDDGFWLKLSSNAWSHARSKFGEKTLAQAVAQFTTWLETGHGLPGQLKAKTILQQEEVFSSKIRVALHAQKIHDGTGSVMGSDITTRHLQDALLRSPYVSQVERFSKYNNQELKGPFDLAIIEGWSDDVPYFISIVRNLNARAVVLHWCLSTWNLNRVVQLDVDGFLTNSNRLLPHLAQAHPAAYLPLGAPQSKEESILYTNKYAHGVVYLGQPAFHKKSNLYTMLTEAMPHGLAIYGSKEWVETEFRSAYQGVLPIQEIEDLYRSATVVLAVTVDAQKVLGMINNRIYEALAAGAVVLADRFEELEETFGSSILYHRQPGDTDRILHYFGTRKPNQRMRARSIAVSRGHSYDRRVRDLFQFLHTRFRGFPGFLLQ